MTAEEFIAAAVNSDYASKRIAKQYAGTRDSFSDDDFIHVNRMYERLRDQIDRIQSPGSHGVKAMYQLNGKTTKHFRPMGSDQY